MSISDKISFLWNKAVEDAIGAGHADPFAYADEKVASLRATIRRVERFQEYGDNHPRVGCRAGRRQAAERR